MVEISTKTKTNLEKLVEAILLQAELLDLKTDFETNAKGIVYLKLTSEEDQANIIVTAGTKRRLLC